MVIIIDTNIAISALLSPLSIPGIAFKNAMELHKVISSEATMNELIRKIPNSKFDKYLDLNTRFEFLDVLIEDSELISISTHFTLCRDSKDNIFLDLAYSGKADFIITGDKDLLSLDPFYETRIVTPTDFLKLIKKIDDM
ncbi:MAG: uncharacterized protein QG635_1516 [Bacteroidota bacterium]|nr:uncharacterized protein [Bacteroidota bacterium]